MKSNPLIKTLSFMPICAAMLLPLGAQAKAHKNNMTIELVQSLYKQHHDRAALQKARVYQSLYPRDPDVYFYIGMIQYRQKNYVAAQKAFEVVLRLYPTYDGARKFLFDSLIAQQNYVAAIQVAEAGLADRKSTTNWQYQKANAYYAKGDYYQAVSNLKPIAKTDLDAGRLYQAINRETGFHYLPHFEAGFDTNTMPVNRPNETWLYNSVYASYVNRYGNFGGEVRQARRFNRYAYQYNLIAWPNITDHLYLHLAYGHSETPELFPNNDYLGEAYLTLPHGFELWGGGEYRDIANTSLTSYWGGVGKYFLDNYYISFSPLFFSPKSGPNSVLYRFKLRRYFGRPDKFIGLAFATGQSPDLADLLTVNFFKTDYTYAMVEGQYPVKDYMVLNYGVGYSWQKFPQGYTRRMAIFNVGLKFRFI
jgi:YaiO family outer membrane protein